MNFGVFVLGLEENQIQQCSQLERSLYSQAGIGFWVVVVLSALAGGLNLYYINDSFFSVALGALLFPVLLGFLYRILLISIKRPSGYFAWPKWKRRVPDFGTAVRFLIPSVMLFLVAICFLTMDSECLSEKTESDLIQILNTISKKFKVYQLV
jgi:hypothetical protein